MINYNNFVDMSKIETGQMKINSKPFLLNNMMDHIFSMSLVNPVYKQKNTGRQNIVLRYDKPEKNIAIMSDPNRLKQIFVNLINNALKFTDKGFVYFGYTVKNGEVIFYVMDSGIGISTDKMNKIFDRSTQVNHTFARKINESGLGLAVSKGLTNLLNGKMWCMSDLGRGSNFYFSIPFRPATMLCFANQSTNKNNTLNL